MKADKIYLNGKIYTVNEKLPWAEAVAVKGDKIICVGNRNEVLAFADDKTHILNLEGKMMLPGFIDGHCHPLMAAHMLSGIVFDIEWTLEKCLDEIKQYVTEHPDDENYFGLGYSEIMFDDRGPRKELLDDICNEKPMFFMGSGGHEGWANSKCFQEADITKDTPDPLPGLHFFSRDKKGNPAGHVVEGLSLGKILCGVNFFDEKSVLKMMEEISEGYAAMGVTATADMGIYPFMAKQYFDTLDKVRATGSYKQRFIGCTFEVEDVAAVDERILTILDAQKKYNDDRFRINFLKIINDGTMESRTAAISEPYPEDGSVIQPLMNEKEASEAGIKIAKAGLDVNMHAIGDVAVKSVIAMAKAIRQTGYDDCRVTCSHSEYIAQEDIPLFGKYNIIANTTGVWMYGNPFMDKVLGHINNELFRMRSLIDGGARMALGSDFPIDEYGREPLKSIEMCATRRMYDKRNAPVMEPVDEKTTVEEAIEGFTINNAYQMHMENVIGSIEAGKYADFVILEDDITDIPLENIHKVRVCETIINGSTVYEG